MAEIDLLLKLFDTLKEAIRDIQVLLQAMLTNQSSIGSYVKNLPDAIKDHAKESSDDIGTCKETVETQSDTILKEVKALKGKVKTMIVVVTVAFSLFSAAVLIGTIATTIGTDTSHEALIDEIKKLKKELNEVRKDKP